MRIHTVAIAGEGSGGVDLAALAGAATGDVVWLDSGVPEGLPDDVPDGASTGRSARARWSVLALCDGPFAAAYVHEDRVARVMTTPAGAGWFGVAGTREGTAFGILDALLAATPRIAEPVDGCGFALGWVGYLGYELGREVGGPDRTADGHPDLDLRFVDRAVVVDHATGSATALALVDDAWPDESAANVAWAASVAAGSASDAVSVPASATVGALCGGASLQAVPVARVTRAVYEASVDACRAEIREGNAFQVCLTTVFGGDGLEARVGSDAFGAYLGLRAGRPVPFGAFLRLGDVVVASRSPERFLRIDADGTVVAEPIKGTRPRGLDAASDAALRAELAGSAKDRAENVMIVDLLRNDLLRSAVPGSVHVERFCDVESYAGVHQMVSTVAGRLPSGAARGAVVRAAFPPGSMTGAPKISAMAIADRLEGEPRGVYSGVLGYFSASGAVDLSVVIRAVVAVGAGAEGAGAGAAGGSGPRPGSRPRVSVGAGGAVTWSSSASDEADEVATKVVSALAGIGVDGVVW